MKLALTSLVTALALGCSAAPPPPPPPPPTPAAPVHAYLELAQPVEPPAQPVTAVLDVAAVAADLDLLGYALDRGYGGRRFVPAAAWEAMRARLDGLRGAPRAVGALCDALGDALWELPDAHLLAKRRVDEHGAHTICGARFKAAQRPMAVGAPYAAAEATRPWVVDFLTVGHATFGVLAVHHFPASTDPAWGDYDRAVGELLSANAVVVDLRHNSGGDDARGLQLARALLDAPGAMDAVRVHDRRTPEALTLLLNTTDRMARGPDGVLAPWSSSRYAALTRDREEAASHPQEERVREMPPAAAPGPKAFRGPVAVLVDSGCASSCELTLQALRRHPRARVFGERTGGYVNFGEVGSLVLPNSGVEVGIPTKYFELPENRILDKVGFDPDVTVPAGKDAFDAATAWLIEGNAEARVVPPADYEVSPTSRETDTARLQRLGLDVPPGGVVLEKPYALPLSRRSFAVPGGWLQRRAARVVYAPALLADLDALETVMRRAYGGFERAQKRGWDWDGWFATWRRQLAAAGARWLPVKEAFEPVHGLERFQLDNHTTIPLGTRFGSGSRVYRLAEAGKGKCDAARDKDGHEVALDVANPAQQPRATLRFDGKDLTPAHWIALPALDGDLTALRCGTAWIPLAAVPQPAPAERLAQVNDLAGQAADRPTLKHLGDAAAVLRLPTFSKQNGEIIARERASWDRPTGKEKALVVDLRGNDGGDAAWSALEGWVAAADLDGMRGFEQRKGASCLYPALRWGYSSMSSYGLSAPLSDGMKQGLAWSVDQLFQKDDPACPARFEVKPNKHHYGDPRGKPRPGKPRLVVLVDGGCGSDCEYLASGLARLPETIVVGLNTYGVTEYIQPGYSVLPNTRLPFRIALGTATIYGDGRSVDGYGLDVDVLVDGKEAWTRDAVLRLVGVVDDARVSRSLAPGVTTRRR